MLSYSAKLILTPEQRQELIQIMEWERASFNKASEILFDIKELHIMKLHNKLYKDFRKSVPNCPSQVVIKGMQAALASHRAARKNKVEWSKPFIKKKLSIQLDKRIFSQKGDIFSIISANKRIKCKIQSYDKLDEMFSKYKFSDPKLFIKDNEIYISFPFKTPELISNDKLALGVDLGIRRCAATSEGNLYIDKEFNKQKRRLRYLKRQLQTSIVNKKSNTAKRHLRKLKQKEANINKNFIHNLSKQILNTKADVIVLENLKSLKVKKYKYQNKNKISQVSFAKLREVLSYKALLLGKRVIDVCPSFTSQIDSRTGKKDGVRLGCSYKASDGRVLDADINAAVNIGLRCKLPLLLPGDRIYLGQGKVNTPIVGCLNGDFRKKIKV